MKNIVYTSEWIKGAIPDLMWHGIILFERTRYISVKNYLDIH
jgi:hypothetical protein